MTRAFETSMNLFGGNARTRESMEITPEWAIVYSVGRHRGPTSGRGDLSMFTSHSIVRQGRRRQLGPGRPIEAGDARDLLGRLSNAGMTLLPERVVAFGPTGFAWLLPAAVRPMYWKTADRPVRMMVPWPSLLLIARAQNLFVYARDRDGRPEPAERLFHAPLGNIYDGSTMCWGTVACPEMSVRSIPAYERALTDTYFTHANHTKAVKGLKSRDALIGFWRQLDKGKAAVFPVESLVHRGLTAEQACDD